MPRTPNNKRDRARGRQPATRCSLDALIEKATIDAYGDSEQRAGFFTMIEEHLDLPFEAEVLGSTVLVERVDLNEADEIVAVCRRGTHRQRIPILDLALPRPGPRGVNWIAAYRHWYGGGT